MVRSEVDTRRDGTIALWFETGRKAPVQLIKECPDVDGAAD
jgi:hypothetical protein